MALILLNDEEFGSVITGTNTVFGSASGRETITIGGGVTTLSGDFNAGGDTVRLTGTASQYSVGRSGGTVIVSGPNGTFVNFPAPQPGLTTAQQLVVQFADAAYRLATELTSGVPAITLTNVAAGATPIVISNVTAVPIAAPSTTVAVSATDVVEGGAIVFTFTLQQPQAGPLSLQLGVAASSTAAPGVDFAPFASSISFGSGQTVAFLMIPTFDTPLRDGDRSLSLQSAGAPLSAGADLTATIRDNEREAPILSLTTGADVLIGFRVGSRFIGAQDITRPGKMLDAADVVTGTDSTDRLELIAATGGSLLADLDFTNVTSVETLLTNYASIALGREAAEAGLATIDVRTLTDAQNISTVRLNADGILLDLTADADADGNGMADFTRSVSVSMANSVADTLRVTLAASTGSQFDTGSTFQQFGTPAPAPLAPIDTVVIVGQRDPVRLTFASGAVGDGRVGDTINLAVQAQSENAADVLVGGVTRFDDEGIRFTGAQFVVRDPAGAHRGTFGEVLLGTSLGDTLAAATAASTYLNGGGGNDRLTGGVGADTIIGGTGIDAIFIAEGTPARDTLIVADGDAARGPAGVETVAGFATGVRSAGPDGTPDTADDGFTATADVIDFGSGIVATTSASIAGGVVVANSTLANAIGGAASLLAAVELLEQVFRAASDPAANAGVVAFAYAGNTYVGEVGGTHGAETIGDLVEFTGVAGVTRLADVDGTGAGTALGLAV